jgi:hypothetical protein
MQQGLEVQVTDAKFLAVGAVAIAMSITSPAGLNRLKDCYNISTTKGEMPIAELPI